MLEGAWPGHVVMIGFRALADARAWSASPAYRRSRRCARNIEGDIVLIDGVPEGYDPAAAVQAIRAAAE